MQAQRRSIMGLVFLTVFLDIVGFSVIFPLFPAMLEYYLALEGEGSLLGRLVQQLAELTGGDEFGVQVLFGGLLGSLYSGLQFLSAPLWGGISDRRGRRPTLLITLAGTALSYVLWIFAGSFGLLVVARLLGGVMAGNISTASAVAADISSPQDRAKHMGMIGAAIGLGFVIGPALGGLAGGFDLAARFPDLTAYGLNPFSAAALISLGLALVNFAWAAARFPETLEPGARPEASRTLNPLGTLRTIDVPGVRATNIAYLLYFAAFGAMEFTLTFLAVERLNFEPLDNAYMFVFVGLTIAFVQGGLVRRLIPRIAEQRVAFAGIALTLPGFLLLAWAHSIGTLYAGLAFLAVGSALVMPCLSALVSRYSPAERQGLALGVFRSLGSLARAIGPIAGGLAYWSMGSRVPYIIGAALLVAPLAFVARLPRAPAPEEAT